MRTISELFDDPEVTPQTQKTFDDISNAINSPFTPHFFQVWASSPATLQGIWPLARHILCAGRVSRQLKEMIIVAISSLKTCHYCQYAHAASCTNLGVPSESIQSLIDNYTIEGGDAKEKAAIDFAVKLAKDSKSGSEKDINNLTSLGYDKEEIMEIIAMSGMALFYNHLADASGIVVDQAFKDILADKNQGLR